MRTFGFPTLVTLLLAVPTAGQSAPPRFTPAEEAAVRAEVKRLEIEHSRYDLDATGFEGHWAMTGTRRIATETTGWAGELTIQRAADGTYMITGKAVLTGRNVGKWEGTGKLDGGNLVGSYKATIAGEGEATFKKRPDGTLALSFEGGVAPRAKGEATATRPLAMTREQLEAKLFDVNTRLQTHRYPRPAPLRYRSPTRKTELRLTPTVEFDPNGVEQQVIDFIDAARTSIDLCVFEFSLIRVAEALVRAKERGVKIRMVYDNREEEQPSIKLIQARGIEARSDARAAYMHNKFMIVDGQMLWTGSTNLAPNGIYVADNNAVSFKNAALCVEYKKEFDEMFVEGLFGVRSPANTNRDWLVVDTGVKVQVRFAPEDEAMARVLEAVKGAKRSIKFMAFAFTSRPLCDAMVERMQAGVKVEGIFEALHAGWAEIKIGPLNAAGAKVRFDKNPNAHHHKVIIIDDKVVCTGSFNFSEGADRQNDENLLVIDSRPIAQTFAREFANIFATTDPNDPRIATAGMGGGTTTDGDEDRGLSDAIPGN